MSPLLTTRALARRLRDQGGRTLMELLVGLAITSIVGVGLSSIVVQGFRLSYTFPMEDQRVYPVRNALDLVVTDVRRARSIVSSCNGQTAVRLDAGGGATEVVTFTVDSSHRLIRTAYSTSDCTPAVMVSQLPVGYQITDFTLDRIASTYELAISIEAISADGQPFTLNQTVAARLVGQP